MKIEIVPPVDTQKYLEFDCRDKKDRVISQLKLRNHGDTTIAFKLMTTSMASFMVKPGLGMIDSQTDMTITIVLVFDPSKVTEIEKQKFSLTLLELEFPVDLSDLNVHIKQKKSLATTHVFDVKVLQLEVHPYLPSGGSQKNIGMHQPTTHVLTDNKMSQSPVIGMSHMDNRYSVQFKSALEDDFNQKGAQVETNTRSSLRNVEAKTEESLMIKERMINQLQDEKKRLESDLEEIKRRTYSNKVVEKTTTNVKAFETWQLVGVVIVALFLGYLLGTK